MGISEKLDFWVMLACTVPTKPMVAVEINKVKRSFLHTLAAFQVLGSHHIGHQKRRILPSLWTVLLASTVSTEQNVNILESSNAFCWWDWKQLHDDIIMQMKMSIWVRVVADLFSACESQNSSPLLVFCISSACIVPYSVVKGGVTEHFRKC